MNLWRIALKSIWQNRKRYIAFVASAAFSVMIFFLYMALIFHPDLQGGYRYAAYALQGMKAASVVIVVFTFLFLLYSSSTFVRFRMKEFGMLSLMGVTRGQLVMVILRENITIALVALVAGIGAGLLFLKLFFMTISALLRLPEPLPFYVGPNVWLSTFAIFGGLFVVVSLASARLIFRRSILDMVRAHRQPKATPTFSWCRLVVGLLLLLGGYLWASSRNQTMVVVGIIPVTLLVTVATVILMREAGIAFLTWLHKRERYFYRPGPFLTISQLAYKIQDNYRVLAAVAVLVAVILTAVGTVSSLYVVTISDVIKSHPVPVQLALYDGGGAPRTMNEINTILAKHGIDDMTFNEIVALQGILRTKGTTLPVFPYSFYQARRGGDALTLNSDDEAILIYPGAIMSNADVPSTWDDEVKINEESLHIKVRSDEQGRIINPARDMLYNLIVSDAVYAKLLQRTPAGRQRRLYIWSGEWQNGDMYQAVSELRNLVADNTAASLTMTGEDYVRQMISMGILLFIGLFVSLVFFAACFSLLYSRLFMEIDDDRKYIYRLQQLGVTEGELRHQALGQAAVIFFVPYIAGLLHSTFAMQALGTLTRHTMLFYGWGIALAYLVVYAICFAGTGRLYWCSIRPSLNQVGIN